jgi:hypothetical protein
VALGHGEAGLKFKIIFIIIIFFKYYHGVDILGGAWENLDFFGRALNNESDSSISSPRLVGR